MNFKVFILAALTTASSASAQVEPQEQDDVASPLDQVVPVAEEEKADTTPPEDSSTLEQRLGQEQDDVVSPLDQVVPVAEEEKADTTPPEDSSTLEQRLGQEQDDVVSPLDQVVPVAEEEKADTTPPEDSSTLEQRLGEEFDRYRQLINDEAMDEADASAKRIVEMVIRLYGPRSIEASKALNNLAIVQSRNEQYDAAIQNFQSAVDIIETADNRLSDQLVNPLTGLGNAQLKKGRPDLAAATFNRARHITHVNEGPHNIQQVEILEALAQATLMAGDSKSARQVLDRIHALNVRHFAGDNMALVPSLMRRANWQHAARYYNDERATYRRIIRILEGELGKEDPQLILPLSKLGESFYFTDMEQGEMQQRGLVATGEIYFRRAARIAEATPDLHWSELARVKLALADHYTYAQSNNRARSIYTDVWNLLSEDEERLDMRREQLEQPVALFKDAIPKYAFSGGEKIADDEELLTGTIRVEYTVSERGRVRNIRTEAIPKEFTDMQRMVHREIRRRVFRPQMSDAKARASDTLVFEHKFFYRQADLDKLTGKTQQTADSST